jgi:hypothetical protein
MFTCKHVADMGQRRSLVLRTIYALCLLGATYNHWAEIIRHGLFWDHGGFPKASTTFWTALAVLDPAAAILLFVRPNVGVVGTAAIIIADVIHNVWIEAHYFPPLLYGLANAPQVIEQIVFMIFVLVTARFAWRPEMPAKKR